jgi:hypothetical protein
MRSKFIGTALAYVESRFLMDFRFVSRILPPKTSYLE